MTVKSLKEARREQILKSAEKVFSEKVFRTQPYLMLQKRQAYLIQRFMSIFHPRRTSSFLSPGMA
jgi:predicted unusual protein kinase regulating ubiquinone biosynthesis (AarF/ABC1/UbiB family)